jgi:transposase
MARGRPLKELSLTQVECFELERIAESTESRQRLRQRARIILACATGATNQMVAAQEQVFVQTVCQWRSRFLENRVSGLRERPRSGRPGGLQGPALELTEHQRADLQRFTLRLKTSQALARRCRVILGSVDGASDIEVATKEGISRQTVGKWKRRFRERGVDGLLDEPRPGGTA